MTTNEGNGPELFQSKLLPSGRSVLIACGPFQAPFRPVLTDGLAALQQGFGRLVAVRELGGTHWFLVVAVPAERGVRMVIGPPVVPDDQVVMNSAPVIGGHLPDDVLPMPVPKRPRLST